MEKLLKYPVNVFQKSEFFFGIGLPGFIIFLIFLALIAVTILAYRGAISRTNRFFRGLLIAFRAITLMIIVFSLLKPFITVPQINPEDSYLLVLVDDSKSMQIADCSENKSRIEAAGELLFNPQQGLINQLKQRFKTRLFAFSSGSKRISATDALDADGDYTDIPESLNEALEDLKGVPLSGAVLISDGADKSGEDIVKVGYRLRERKVPVHAVGIGSTEGVNDLELVRVDAPQKVEENYPVEIWITVRRSGYSSRKVTVTLNQEGRELKQQSVNLDKKHQSQRISMKFIPRTPGTHKYIVRVHPEPDEIIRQNNEKKFLLKVSASKKTKILYVEGNLRWEFKFIRRALENDPNVQLTARVMTAPNTIWGLGRMSGEGKFELYPESKEELFSYDGVIWGNVEASKFSLQQLEYTADFVKTRGGGFLMLGGSRSLGGGTYINTPIAKMLPVELERNSESGLFPPVLGVRGGRNSEFDFKLTPEGKSEPMLRLDADVVKNEARWRAMPTLKGYSWVKRAKPGATVLAVHPNDKNEFGRRILLAAQNYGAGRSMVFTPYSSWRWQMLGDDDSHEKFWRQVAKWLTTTPKERLKLQIEKSSYSFKEPVFIDVVAYDEKYEPTNHAQVRATITDDTGNRKELTLKQALGKDGLYRARFVPPKRGEYTVDITGSLHDVPLGEQRGLFEVAESYVEFTHAELNSNLLMNLAQISGGRYYPLEEAHNMVDEIPLIKSGASTMVDKELWDMPLIFLIIILLLAVEWFLRKRRGLA
ncbi:MAG: hypothetical protein ACE5PV_11940 [Candidatus Poribacteria bacterium]